MCTSALQIVFTILLVAGTAATLISMFTPGWRSMSVNNVTSSVKNGDMPSMGGILKFLCNDGNTGMTSTSSSSSSSMSMSVCEAWWQNKPDWEKVVIAAMALAVVAEAIAIIWSFVSCFMCCCKSCLTPPLPILTALATICLLVAVITFGVKNKDQIHSVPTSTGQLNSNGNVGYSFWIAILAVVIMAVDTVVGILMAKSAKVSPI